MVSRETNVKVFDSYQHGLQTRQLSTAQLTSTLMNRNSQLQNYHQLQQKQEHLTEQYSLLQLQVHQGKQAMAREKRQQEQTASELRAVIEQETARLKALGFKLEDAREDGDRMKRLRRDRDEEIDRLADDTEELRRVGEGLDQAKGTLLSMGNQIRAEIDVVQEKVRGLAGRERAWGDKLDRVHRLLIELKLAGERKNEQLKQYEVENNGIDREIIQMAESQAKLQDEVARLSQLIKQQLFQQTEARTDLGRLQIHLAKTRQFLASERQKFTDLSSRVKTRQRLLSRLQQQLLDQQLEADYLVKKNGQVSEVNDNLKKDWTSSDRHVKALTRNNQQLQDEIDNFRKQDRTILAQIENRPTPRLTKLEESKITQASSILKTTLEQTE